jgi:hypothetical protein
LSFNADILRKILDKYVIDKVKYPYIPNTLSGEILLEEHKDASGNILGWITITPDNLANILNMRDNPTSRPNIVIDRGKYKGRNLQTLTKDEFEDVTGHKKYLDKWRAEGINI